MVLSYKSGATPVLTQTRFNAKWRNPLPAAAQTGDHPCSRFPPILLRKLGRLYRAANDFPPVQCLAGGQHAKHVGDKVGQIGTFDSLVQGVVSLIRVLLGRPGAGAKRTEHRVQLAGYGAAP
jgi:hypothetical protein